MDPDEVPTPESLDQDHCSRLNHIYTLGWVAPDDMHMVGQKKNISQPGAEKEHGCGSVSSFRPKTLQRPVDVSSLMDDLRFEAKIMAAAHTCCTRSHKFITATIMNELLKTK